MVDFTVTGRNDADTFTLEGREQTSRSAGIGSPEVTRKTKDSDGEKVTLPNTAGLVAKAKSEAFLPDGSTIKVDQQTTGQFGRIVENQIAVIDDVDVDYDLIALDNQMAIYETKYRNKDLKDNKDYQVFMSSEAPFEMGATSKGLTQERYTEIFDLRQRTQQAMRTVMEDATPENQSALDALTVELYTGQNKEDLLDFHFMNHPSARTKEDGTFILQEDPWMTHKQMLIYNQRQKGNIPEADTWYEPATDKVEGKSTFDAYFNKYNDIANISKLVDRSNANKHAELDFEVSLAEKLEGVPYEHQAKVLAQKTNRAALLMRDLIVEAGQDDALIEASSMWEGVVYGGAAFLASPATIFAGAKVAQGAIKTTQAAGQMIHITTRGAPAYAAWANSAASKNVSLVNTWVTGSAASSAVAYAPNLVGSPTATLRRYGQDVLVDTAFGGAIGSLAVVNKAVAGTKLGNFIGLQNDKIIAATRNTVSQYHDRISDIGAEAITRAKAEAKKARSPNERKAFGIVKNQMSEQVADQHLPAAKYYKYRH